MTIRSAASRPLWDIPFNDWFKAFELEPKEAYRVRQVHTWVFERRVKTFAEMNDLPESLREKWEGAFCLRTLVLRRREVSALPCNHTYNAQQIEWFKAGGALNIIRAQHVCLSICRERELCWP